MSDRSVQDLLESVSVDSFQSEPNMTTSGSALEISFAQSLSDPDMARVSVPKHSREMQYWRLCEIPECLRHTTRKGWITVGPSYSPRTAVEYVEYQNSKHGTPLPQYGKAASGEMFGGPTRFGPLIRAGGIKEMPQDQMIAYGWHRRPQLRAIFPELLQVKDIYCEYGCPTQGPNARIFVAMSDYQDHCSIMHKEVVGSDSMGRKVQETLAATIQAQTTRSQEDWAQLAAAFVKALEEREK